MNVREWALPVYTILMQMAVGALFSLWMLRLAAESRFKLAEIDRITRNPIMVIFVTAAMSMVAAHFHLSKPFHSYLAVLNFKTSWLSREIFFTAILFWLLAGLAYLSFFSKERRKLISILGWLAIINGIILVYCMAHIYLLPTQVAWNSNSVIISFFVTALLLGAVTLACLLVLDLRFAEIQHTDDIEIRKELIKYSLAGTTCLVIILAAVSIAIIYYQMHMLEHGSFIAQTSLRLMLELYFPLLVIRQVLLIGSSIFLGAVVFRMYSLKLTPQRILVPVYLSTLFILVGEIVGRFLFYAAHIRVGL